MNISQVFNAANVWTVSTRTLSGGGGSFVTNDGGDALTISNGTTVTFATSAGTMRMISVVGIATANATYNFGLTNGTNFRQGQAGVSGAAATFLGCCNSSEAVGLNNSGTVAGSYTFAGCDWKS